MSPAPGVPAGAFPLPPTDRAMLNSSVNFSCEATFGSKRKKKKTADGKKKRKEREDDPKKEGNKGRTQVQVRSGHAFLELYRLAISWEQQHKLSKSYKFVFLFAGISPHSKINFKILEHSAAWCLLQTMCRCKHIP